MVRSFSTRSTEAELMDDAAVSSEELDACLRDLARVNVLMRAHQPTIAWLERAARDLGPGDRLSVLDVGFGQGDLLRRIHAWCVGRGLRPDLVGVDLSPWSAVAARAATAPGTAIDYRTGDIFAFTPERPLDVVVSSQFTHHLPDDAVVAFLRFMESTARRGWFVSDLHRHPVPFYGFALLARIARWHRFVRHDGPVSIARAFRRQDWERLLHRAGIDPAAVEIRWHVPFRLCVGRLR
ncbi:MAG TPA: methyltransferase domain-containing protein [Microvirga sp.]|nr:methyltransferase domain-containing protein [Microvirga sp.]